MSELINCQLCNKEFRNVRALRSHIKAHKDITTEEEYYDKYLKKDQICSYEKCDKEIPFEYTHINCCSYSHFYTKKIIEKGNDNHYCKICNSAFETLGALHTHVKKNHQEEISTEDYYRKYLMKEDETDSCLWCEKKLKIKTWGQGYSKFCYNKDCNVRWYNKHTGRNKKAAKTLSKVFQENPEKLAVRIEYYLAKGYSQEEASLMLSDRQTTFSKEICIEKHGKEKGLEVWAARQQKWLKNYKKNNFSMVSQELFWELYEHIKNDFKHIYFATNDNGKRNDNVNKEFRLNTKKSARLLDFYIKDINICVEFIGHYWHGEGRGNRTRDEIREKEILDVMPDLKIFNVEELDYKKNKDEVIQKCLDFIYDRKEALQK